MSGVKHDLGKPRPSLVLGTMAKAIKEVVKVATFGAEKYSDNNWLWVENAKQRYTDAMYRHLLAGEGLDHESGLSHAAHAAWNALARLELELRESNVKNPVDPSRGLSNEERVHLIRLEEQVDGHQEV